MVTFPVQQGEMNALSTLILDNVFHDRLMHESDVMENAPDGCLGARRLGASADVLRLVQCGSAIGAGLAACLRALGAFHNQLFP